MSTAYGRIPTRGSISTPMQVAVAKNLVSAIPVAGQLKMTGVALQLPSGVLNNGVVITAYSANTLPILLGISTVTNVYDGTGNGYILEPGGSISWALGNTNQLYAIGTSGDILSWAGS